MDKERTMTAHEIVEEEDSAGNTMETVALVNDETGERIRK